MLIAYSSMRNGSPNLPERWPTIAVIGCGAITETFYLPAFKHCAHLFRQLILVDSDLERARGLGQQFQVTNYLTDYRDILGLVDGVIIAVPHHLHYSISKDLLTAGVHVLCEKPLAQTGPEAKEMIRLADENGVTISVNNTRDRKSTRLNSSHGYISYAVFCLKKK